jgi:L-asparaginase
VSGLPRVDVLALGGTIASSADDGEGARVNVSGGELLAGVPGVAAIAEVQIRSVQMVASGDLTMRDMLHLRALIESSLETGAAGVVVMQGTDTLEETSYAMELLTSSDEPIVFTGAMRNSSAAGSDGPANLLAAVRVAASESARGLGTLVVFNDEIHSSRHVRKRHATSTATFGSALTGPLGSVTEERVRILVRPTGRFRVRVAPQADVASVAQLSVHFDSDDKLIRAVPSLGYAGLVLAAFGAGHVPSWIVPALAEVAEEIPVVLASRTNAGEGLRSTYAYAGSEIDLLSRGLISAVSLDTAHATVLLRLLLMAGVEPSALARCFEEASHPIGLVNVPVSEDAK